MIDQTRLLTLFQRLVSIDSPSGGERGMCDTLREILKALGLDPQEDDTAEKIGGTAGNLYTYIEGTLDLPPILLSAHMDTVAPAMGKKAICHPDGTVTSDGTTVLGADDVSGLAAILEALFVLKADRLPHRPLELLFDVSEETYCTGIQKVDFSKIRSKEAYVLDLDGPVGCAAYQAPSIISFQCVFYGRSAHAAFAPESGIHAIKAAAQAIDRIPCGHVGKTTVNVGTVTGGIATNIVPDQCMITGEVRSFSHEDACKQMNAIEEICLKTAEEFGATAVFQNQTLCSAYCVDTKSPVVQRFQKACATLSLPGTLQQTYGGSVNNHFVPHGIDGIVVAPGMNCCHSCQEYTSLSELQKAANLVLTLMLSKE